MYDTRVNQVIDRIVRDPDFSQDVLQAQEAALAEYELDDEDVQRIIAALEADHNLSDDAEPFSNLRQLARIDHLFAAVSASSTKVG